MEARDRVVGVRLAGGNRLALPLEAAGALIDPVGRGLVYDASDSDPRDWAELEVELNRAFELTRQAVLEGGPIVYVVHEPSVWGHEPPLRSTLATALLGGMRSAALELTRSGLPANAVALSDPEDVDEAADCVAWLLQGRLTGQLLTCGATHLGRPAV